MSPGTMADSATVGTVAWTNPDNAKVSDGVYAVFQTAVNSPYEKYAQIVKSNGAIGSQNKSSNVVLGTDIVTYKPFGSSSDLWGETWSVSDINSSNFGFVYGVSNGVTTPYSHYLKATNFGFSIPTGSTINGIIVEMQLRRYYGGGSYAYVDHIRITVDYTPPVFIAETSGSVIFSGKSLRQWITSVSVSGQTLFSGLAKARPIFKALVSGAVTFSGVIAYLLYADKSVIRQKTYLWKVYDPDGVFLGVLDDVTDDPSWSEELNSAGSSMNITLARNADSSIIEYEPLQDSDIEDIVDSDGNQIDTILQPSKKVGAGSILAHNNRVECTMFNADYPNGLKKFSGFISEIVINYGDKENTDLQLTSYGYDLDNYLVVDGSGNTTVAFNSTDPGAMVRTALTQFKADGIDTQTDYTNSTVLLTGTTPSYTFRANTYRELIEKAVQLAPTGFSYHVGLGDNLVYFIPKPTVVDHKFFLGKHIKTLTLRSYIGDVINDVLFTGGIPSGDTENLFIRNTITPEAGTRRGLTQLSDSRVTITDSADLLSTGTIDDKKNIQYRSTIDILDTTYDIESIQLGDLVGFANFDNFVDAVTMQVVAITYSPDSLNIQLDTIPKNVNKRLEELKKAMLVADNTTVPDIPA